MQGLRIWRILLVVVGGVVLVGLSLGLLAVAPAQAKTRPPLPLAESGSADSDMLTDLVLIKAQIWTTEGLTIFLDDTSPVQVLDPGGTLIGEGVHGGGVTCRNNCQDSTLLQLDGMQYTYKVKRSQDVDAIEKRAIIEGTGTIDGNGRTQRFSFTASFEDNGDGTISAAYDASISGASFIIPSTVGTLRFGKP